MTTKQKLITGYFAIALLFGLYGWLFGSQSYRGFFYNIGLGIAWPVTIFPSLGYIIGGIFVVAMVVGISVFGKRQDGQ